jgi:hypothetical protein
LACAAKATGAAAGRPKLSPNVFGLYTLRIRDEGDPIGRLAVVWEGRPLLQKVAGWIVAILVIVWIISDPAAAGNTVHDWIAGIITFFEHLA